MDWVSPNEPNRTQLNLSESKWTQVKPIETKWIQVNPSESKLTHVSLSEPNWHWDLIVEKPLTKFYVLIGLDIYIWLVKVCNFMDSKAIGCI